MGSGTLTTASNITLINNAGTLAISHTGTISNTYNGANAYAITSTGTVNKTGSGTITAAVRTIVLSAYNEGYSIGGEGSATATLTGGTVENSNKLSAFYWNSSGTATLSNSITVKSTVSSFNQNAGAILIDKGTVNIKAGSYTATNGGYALQNRSSSSASTVTIEGGTFRSYSYGIQNRATGTINVWAGTFTGNNYDAAANNGKGTLSIHAGTGTGYRMGVFTNGYGATYIQGGTWTGKTEDGFGINGDGTGTSSVTGVGAVIVGGRHGIANYGSAALTVGGGSDTYSSSANPLVTGKNGYGVYSPKSGWWIGNGQIRGTTNYADKTPNVGRSGYKTATGSWYDSTYGVTLKAIWLVK